MSKNHILILGGTGFIGNALLNRLSPDHQVTIGGRKGIDGYPHWRKVDFLANNDWNAVVEGIDIVINSIGIIEGDFDRVQSDVPIELYKYCIEKNIRIISVSAIGAEKENPVTTFLETKKKADDFLLQYENAKVIYPGVVIGRNGKSTQFFTEIAQFPIIPLFKNASIAFVHVNQLTSLIKNIIRDFNQYPQQIFAVSESEPLQDVFSALKGKKGRFVKIPIFFFNLLFIIFPKAAIGIFNKATLQMFQHTTVDDYDPIFPKVSKSIVANNHIKSTVFPKLFALLAISFIWIWSGVSSLVSWDESYALMQEVGANHQMSNLFIYLGSWADIFLGIAIFSRKYRKSIIVLSLLTMFTYMLILTFGAPHYWIHPFGVLSKNIPLIALSYWLYQVQD